MVKILLAVLILLPLTLTKELAGQGRQNFIPEEDFGQGNYTVPENDRHKCKDFTDSQYNVYHVVLKLNRQKDSYIKLFNKLREALEGDNEYWRFTESTWLIHTKENEDGILYHFRNLLKKDDRFLIIKVKKNIQGLVAGETPGWLIKHIK